MPRAGSVQHTNRKGLKCYQRIFYRFCNITSVDCGVTEFNSKNRTKLWTLPSSYLIHKAAQAIRDSISSCSGVMANPGNKSPCQDQGDTYNILEHIPLDASIVAQSCICQFLVCIM